MTLRETEATPPVTAEAIVCMYDYTDTKNWAASADDGDDVSDSADVVPSSMMTKMVGDNDVLEQMEGVAELRSELAAADDQWAEAPLPTFRAPGKLVLNYDWTRDLWRVCRDKCWRQETLWCQETLNLGPGWASDTMTCHVTLKFEPSDVVALWHVMLSWWPPWTS